MAAMAAAIPVERSEGQELVFASAPFIVIWEVTRACALACVHCRAEAMPHRHPDELTTEEGRRLIDQIAAFAPRRPLFVLTGGDPLRRRDIAEFVRYGVERGLSVSLTPSGTAAVTRARLGELRDAGLARLAVSLDGSSEEAHDAFRRVRGSYRYTMRIIADARDLGLPLQVNTTVARQTVADLPRTEAPQYHRVLTQRSRASGEAAEIRGVGRAGRAVTDDRPSGRAERGGAVGAVLPHPGRPGPRCGRADRDGRSRRCSSGPPTSRSECRSGSRREPHLLLEVGKNALDHQPGRGAAVLALWFVSVRALRGW